MPPSIAAHARSTVRELLSRSPAYAALPAAGRASFRANLEKVAVYLAGPEGIPGNIVAGGAAVAVDLPEFVSSLIHGVFDSIVASSIEQMEAYAKLLADAALAVGEYTRVADSKARPLVARQRSHALLTCLRIGFQQKPRRHAVKPGIRRRASSSPRA